MESTVSLVLDGRRRCIISVMDAILRTGLSLGDVLVDLFTLAAPYPTQAHADLVDGFLSGTTVPRMSAVLDALFPNRDGHTPGLDEELSFLDVPYTRLADARSILLAWAAQSFAALLPLQASGQSGSLNADPSRTLSRWPERDAVPYSCPSCAAMCSSVSLFVAPPAPSTPLHDERVLQVRLFDTALVVNASITSKEPIDRGASATVWRGEMGGEMVALKVYRSDVVAGDTALRELIIREESAWQKLRHPRLLKLLGSSRMNAQPVLVSPYASNGNMLQYLQRKPDADRLRLVTQVSEGLIYLHDEARLVHGDVKCQNVLISDSGDAMLADFGLSTLIDKYADDMTTCTDIRIRGTLRFSAPELFNEPSFADEDCSELSPPANPSRLRSKTTQTDVYAFGMLILQTFTSAAPWEGSPDVKVIMDVLSGQTPRRPTGNATKQGFSDIIWTICLWCWEHRPHHRPHMQLTWHALVAASGPWGRAPTPRVPTLRTHKDPAPLPPPPFPPPAIPLPPTPLPRDVNSGGPRSTTAEHLSQWRIIPWIESSAFEQQRWSWRLLNGVLLLLRTTAAADAFTGAALASVLRAILSTEDRHPHGLSEALGHFAAILRMNEVCGLRLLRADDMLWDVLFTETHELAPGPLLEVAAVLVVVLHGLLQGDVYMESQRNQGVLQWREHLRAVQDSIELLKAIQ